MQKITGIGFCVVLLAGLLNTDPAQSSDYEKRFRPFLTRGELTLSINSGLRQDSYDLSFGGNSKYTAKNVWFADFKGKARYEEPADLFFVKGAFHAEAEVNGGFALGGKINEVRSGTETDATSNGPGGDAVGIGGAIGYRINLTGTPAINARNIGKYYRPKTARDASRKQRAIQNELNNAGPYISVTPLIGYSLQQQTYNVQKTFKNADDTKTDFTYDHITNWYGPYVGIENEIKTRKNMLRLRGEYHDLDFYGEEQRTYKTDDNVVTAPDFEHSGATGYGLLLGAEYSYALSESSVLGAELNYKKRHASGGVSKSPTLGDFDLNEVNDQSRAFYLNYRYYFDY